jgi:hypothetical protein
MESLDERDRRSTPTVPQIATLFVGTPTLAYGFISVILIATSGGIAWYAWNWPDPAALTRR